MIILNNHGLIYRVYAVIAHKLHYAAAVVKYQRIYNTAALFYVVNVSNCYFLLMLLMNIEVKLCNLIVICVSDIHFCISLLSLLWIS